MANPDSLPLPLGISGENPSVEAFNVAVRQAGWETEMRQLDMNAMPVRFSAWAGRDLTLLKVSFPNRVHQHAAPPGNRLTFGVPASPQKDLKIGSASVSSETITCFPDSLESVSEPMFCAYTISLDAERLRTSADRLKTEVDRAFSPESRQFDTRTLTGIRRGLSEVLAITGKSALPEATRATLFENFEAELPGMLSSLWLGAEPTMPHPGPGRRREVIRRTMDLLATDAQRQCQIEDLCDAGACSQRTLERSYREQFGITPKQYLTRIRLAGVHRTLLDSSEAHTIGDLAAHWGFWHLSQFAANYRAMYGELPSETARRTSP
jgi:AraC family ethanolamine operon transcriptional activator